MKDILKNLFRIGGEKNNPVILIEEYLMQLNNQIRELEKQVAKTIAEEKRLQRDVMDAKQRIDARQSQAIRALEENNENLARRALSDKVQVQNNLEQLTKLYKDTKTVAEELSNKLRDLKHDYAETSLQLKTLKSQEHLANLKTQVNRDMANLQEKAVKKQIETLEQQVLQVEADAELADMKRQYSQSLGKDFHSVELEETVDTELAKLKKEKDES
ncbi:PspA/IM30 family protein [Bacillus sp. HMF5848]|uniref:PspA/IM30 family protein n=1 Tax=Bacillus sp. HMF5848 TaxID=2495421 RepID=UPI000F77BDAC|nr:PspA/IM30 family protein [Bacillus sp. HMF5848]RSK25781.1 PspA/IM30 family protein [Bacillus sp. HMF5848]